MLPIPADTLAQLTPGALLGLAILLILTGRLIPLRAYRSMERERDHWREIAQKSTSQVEKLLPGAQIAAQVTQALSEHAGRDQGS